MLERLRQLQEREGTKRGPWDIDPTGTPIVSVDRIRRLKLALRNSIARNTE